MTEQLLDFIKKLPLASFRIFVALGFIFLFQKLDKMEASHNEYHRKADAAQESYKEKIWKALSTIKAEVVTIGNRIERISTWERRLDLLEERDYNRRGTWTRERVPSGGVDKATN